MRPHPTALNDSYGTLLGSDTLRIERLLPGPIERIWAYLTESDKRRQWLASGDMDLQVGGAAELVWRNSELTGHDGQPPPKYARHAGESRMRTRITACDPPRLLAFTWDGDEDSEVRFELTPEGDTVRLRLTHTRLADRDALLSTAAGWHAHLGILVDRLEGRAPGGFWETHTRLEHDYERRLAVP